VATNVAQGKSIKPARSKATSFDESLEAGDARPIARRHACISPALGYGPRFRLFGADLEESRRGPAIVRTSQRSVEREKDDVVPLYEHVFLARQDLSQSQVDALASTATEIVENNQGTVHKTETWGLKNLAYKIKRNRKAHFVMLNIEATGDTILELERQTAINEDVIRWMTIRVDEHEAGPSVMMRKSDRDQRRRREREGN
jgi:small subunit ribosomal protein S6